MFIVGIIGLVMLILGSTTMVILDKKLFSIYLTCLILDTFGSILLLIFGICVNSILLIIANSMTILVNILCLIRNIIKHGEENETSKTRQ